MDDFELEEDVPAPAPAEPVEGDLAPVPPQVESLPLIRDEQLLGVYGEMLDLARQDRAEVSAVLNDFLDMVVNGGDSSSASKEAIVQLLKSKNDSVNTMGKVADLMTRVKLRERDTMPDYLKGNPAATEFKGADKKDLIKQLNKAVKKTKGKA